MDGIGRIAAGALAAAVALIADRPAEAQAACNGVAIDARFTEASRLCAPARIDPARVDPARIDEAVQRAPVAVVAADPAPRSVSIAMPGTARRMAAPSRARAGRGAPADPAALTTAIGRHYRIDPHLLASMMHQESGGRMTAVSNKGALGLMQVMPGTARSVGVSDPRAMLGNPVLAMSAGAVYLKKLQAQFGNNVPLVLAAYNAGPGAVVKAGRQVPRYRETQGYVGAIMKRWQRARPQRAR